MPDSDYKQEIIHYFNRGGFGARSATFQFLKQRTIPGRMVQAISFETKSGSLMYMFCHLVQDVQGVWHFRGAAGGNRMESVAVTDPVRMSLGGGDWPHEFYAGGYLPPSAEDIVRVRLVAANGTQIEDRIEDGLALFLTAEEVKIPLMAELYNAAGECVHTHRAF